MLKVLLANKAGIEREIINFLQPIINYCFFGKIYKVNHLDKDSLEVFLEPEKGGPYNVVIPIAACTSLQSFKDWTNSFGTLD